MGAAFGIDTDYQSNPDDPVVKKVIKSMNPNAWEQIFFFVVLPLLPFGQKIVNSNFGARIIWRELVEVKNITQEVVDAKRKESTQKVLYNEILLK